MAAVLSLLASLGAPIREVAHLHREPNTWLHTLIHGRDTSLPVLLFIIGGQGTPFITFEPQMRELSDTFVYATYTMRGVMSVNSTLPPDGVEGHVDDAVWMASYLSERFDRKIVVSGLSYGADMALQVARRVPERVSAVLSISGFFNVTENLRIAHEHIHNRVPAPLVWLGEALGDKNSFGYIYKLYLTGIYGLISYDCHERWPCIPGTLIGPMDVLGSPFSYSFTFGFSTVFQMSRCIWSFRDIETLTPPDRLDMPVYFFRGNYDLLANNNVLQEYIRQVSETTATRLVVFNKSSHFVPLEENANFHNAMRKIPRWIEEDAKTCTAKTKKG